MNSTKVAKVFDSLQIMMKRWLFYGIGQNMLALNLRQVENLLCDKHRQLKKYLDQLFAPWLDRILPLELSIYTIYRHSR